MASEDISKIRLITDAELYTEGLATEEEGGMLPTDKGMIAAMEYWDTIPAKNKLFVLWVMQAYYKSMVCGAQDGS